MSVSFPTQLPQVDGPRVTYEYRRIWTFVEPPEGAAWAMALVLQRRAVYEIIVKFAFTKAAGDVVDTSSAHWSSPPTDYVLEEIDPSVVNALTSPQICEYTEIWRLRETTWTTVDEEA